MSKEKKEDRSEFTFIKEQIVPRRRGKARKVILSIGSTLSLAVVFGVVARAAFLVSEPLVDKLLGIDSEKKPVTITTTGSEDGSTEENDSSELNTTVDQQGGKQNTQSGAFDSVTAGEPQAKPEGEKIINHYFVQNKIDADVDDYLSMYTGLRKIAQDATDSLVTVTGVANSTNWMGDAYEKDAKVPGLIVGENGVEYLILTSYLELKDSNSIQVNFSEEEKAKASLASYDRETNLAIVAVPMKFVEETTANQIKVAELGESYSICAGTPILAIGAPNGLNESLCYGMVTNANGYAYVTDRKLELFYLDIPICDASNGFILDTRGDVVGVINGKLVGEAKTPNTTVIGMSRVKSLIQDLLNDEKRVYFGVKAEDMPEEALKEAGISNGIYVMEVRSKSPAYEAGIQSGDIILSVDDTEMTDVSSFRKLLDEQEVKKSVSVRIKRFTSGSGKESTIKVVLGKKNH